MKRNLYLLLSFLCFSISLQAESEFRVGVAKLDITPQTPIRLSGYHSRTEETSKVIQKIWVRAIAIENIETQENHIILSLENCGISIRITEEVQKQLYESYKIPKQNLVICATHSHSTPAVSTYGRLLLKNLTEPQKKRIDQYTQFILESLVKVIVKALKGKEKAELSWTQGSVGFAVNRREIVNGKYKKSGRYSDGPVQHRLPVLRVVDLKGKIKALMFNYACHCTTLRAENVICGDWAGIAANSLEEKLDIIALPSIGCGADQNPFPRGKPSYAYKHGKSIVIEIQKLLAKDWIGLKSNLEVRTEKAHLPLKKAKSIKQLRSVIESKKGSIEAIHAKTLLNKIESGEKLATEVELPISCWSFGSELAMIFMGGEVVVDYDLILRKRYKADKLWISSYTNDVPCYIPSKRILQEGGYEAHDSMFYYAIPAAFSPRIEEELLKSLYKIIPKIFKEKE